MSTLTDIEKQTKEFADAQDHLAQLIQETRDEIEKIQRAMLPKIKRAGASLAQKTAILSAAIEASPDLFVKPRTVVFHGVKVGMQKGKGVIEWEDDAQVVKLIKRYLPELAEVLIKTTEKPVKGALSEMSATDLKKIGVTVEDSGDVVCIKVIDGDINKMIKAFLKDFQTEIEAAE
jgi:hypothetical protein